MSIWETQPKYPGRDGDTAQFAVFANGSDSRICIRAVDTVADERAVITMTADRAAAFARDLLDAAMSLQEEQADD
ncbi:hypothetical protein [Pontibaca methylaminivorans]|uniref:Uncharacterized protein n=1 Tax=Pontibaca methylaminivorans TaxID=515897 RepID=A0A1R3W9U7_9RHOB|nr:hypothetical protein [Pontibaca methylaminivorans]SIT74572.1 hypothetical protein SAMN05421849_0180 [Pontibaca methylaminivorans]